MRAEIRMSEFIETVQISGMEYKIGWFGYAYYWNGEEWIKSDKDPEIIQDKIDSNKAQPKLL